MTDWTAVSAIVTSVSVSGAAVTWMAGQCRQIIWRASTNAAQIAAAEKFNRAVADAGKQRLKESQEITETIRMEQQRVTDSLRKHDREVALLIGLTAASFAMAVFRIATDRSKPGQNS